MKTFAKNNKEVSAILTRLDELDPMLSSLRVIEKEAKELKTRLQELMDGNEEATYPGYTITNKLQKRPPIAACEFFVLRIKKVSDVISKLVKKAA